MGVTILGIQHRVALRKESVDRNILSRGVDYTWQASLSARRAWIEMLMWWQSNITIKVALRKESVDRNTISAGTTLTLKASLSARRAWIEIPTLPALKRGLCSRSPQGERG